MKSQEKAKEIFNHFNNETESTSSARRCGIYLVDTILNELEELNKPEYTSFLNNGNVTDGYEKTEFWNDVKELISNIS